MKRLIYHIEDLKIITIYIIILKTKNLALHARRRKRIADLHKRANIERIETKISSISKLFYEKLKTDDSVQLNDLLNVPFRIKNKFIYVFLVVSC